ncbi:hypothetical protein J3F83DRAFT_748739 [Trichoderma novae-zelandiae]
MVVMPDQSPSTVDVSYARGTRIIADSLPAAAALKLLRNCRLIRTASIISEEPVGYKEERNGGVQSVLVSPRSEPFCEGSIG